MIPLVNLKAQYDSIKDEIDAAIARVISESAFIGGKFVGQFERQFANAIGAKHCVGVGNGTDALFLVLKALGIGAGDEVIVPANTFIATAEAVTSAGARVVFADCSADDFCIDPEKAEEKISPKTKALIAVHLYGQPAKMDELLRIAREQNLFLIEDAAQAHLAKYQDRFVGTLGIAGCFSFYPGKNLGAYGDAGAIVTNDEKLAQKARMLANHGRADKYNHLIEGYNSRLDGLQAAILSVKLTHLSGWTKRRREIAEKYDVLLRDVGLMLPKKMPGRESVYHLYVIRAKKRDALREYLKEERIESGIHYPIGLPYLEAYKYLDTFAPENFPITHSLQNEILSLPMYPEFTDEGIKHITNTVKKFYVSQ